MQVNEGMSAALDGGVNKRLDRGLDRGLKRGLDRATWSGAEGGLGTCLKLVLPMVLVYACIRYVSTWPYL